MTDIRTLPQLALRSHDATWNYTRWEQLPEDGNRYEVIDGVLYMTTAPSNFHQWIVRQIVFTLFQQIDQRSVGVTLWSPIGLIMPGCDPVQPDILVIRAADLAMMHDRRIYGVPALLVEVLSPGNPEQDTEVKRGAYARAGVPEYWIVRPSTRDVLMCTRPDAALDDYAQTQLVDPDSELTSPTLPIRVKVADFFAGAPDTTL
jgi:Uma2 family endonuclease